MVTGEMIIGEMTVGMVVGEMVVGMVTGEMVVGMDGAKEAGTDGVMDVGMDTGKLRICYKKNN